MILATIPWTVSGQMGAIVAIDEEETVGGKGGLGSGDSKAASPKAGSGSKNSAGDKDSKAKSSSARKRTTKGVAPRPRATPKPEPEAYDGFVIGDKYTFLNAEIDELVKPVHTIEAKSKGAKGLVQVEVLIDEDGTVLNAKARSGNELLYEEAERAALATVFNKPSVHGRPARATGFVVYRFGPPED